MLRRKPQEQKPIKYHRDLYRKGGEFDGRDNCRFARLAGSRAGKCGITWLFVRTYFGFVWAPRSLKRSASTAILDLLEANVRLGWYLEDARHFLRKEGTYVAWIEQTCPLSYGHTTRLRQLAKHFCRDSIDNLQRLKLGISIPGLLENGEHLRRQIAASQCGSMADMFRYAGLLPSPDRAVASGSNGNGEHANSNANQKKKITWCSVRAEPEGRREQERGGMKRRQTDRRDIRKGLPLAKPTPPTSRSIPQLQHHSLTDWACRVPEETSVCLRYKFGGLS